MVGSIATTAPFALVRLDSKVHSTVSLKIRDTVETLSTIHKIASVNSVSIHLMDLDRRPKGGNLFAAIMATFESAFTVVDVNVTVQRGVA